MNHQKEFPPDFVWGVASSSFQIEGDAAPSRRGRSVWDAFCEQPGAIKNGDTGLVACDHVARVADDVDLLSKLNVKAYRFSISWPRVLPQGSGPASEEGLSFYDRLVDLLLAAGIEPWVTLFHWDFPEPLFHQGGWLNRDSADWFADYTHVVVDRLSDRVRHWMTFNEPQCFLQLGHAEGKHAPGLKLSHPELLQAAHHVLLAHGKSVQVIRKHAKQKPEVGIAIVGKGVIPETESERDCHAADRASRAVDSDKLWHPSWYCDPICHGRYPEDGVELYGLEISDQWRRDLQEINQPLDFLGVNLYMGGIVRGLPDGNDSGNDNGNDTGNCNGNYEKVDLPPDTKETAFGWAVVPKALYWGPKHLYEQYGLPIVITENGMSNHDTIDENGMVSDPERIEFVKEYLRESRRAIADGVQIKGYFYWTMMDNFEWAEGFGQRFGLVYVNFDTQQRIPKESARWYRKVIDSNGRELDAGLLNDLDTPTEQA